MDSDEETEEYDASDELEDEMVLEEDNFEDEEELTTGLGIGTQLFPFSTYPMLHSHASIAFETSCALAGILTQEEPNGVYPDLQTQLPLMKVELEGHRGVEGGVYVLAGAAYPPP